MAKDNWLSRSIVVGGSWGRFPDAGRSLPSPEEYQRLAKETLDLEMLAQRLLSRAQEKDDAVREQVALVLTRIAGLLGRIDLLRQWLAGL